MAPTATVTGIGPVGTGDALDQWASQLYRPAFPPAWAVPVAAGTLWDAAKPESRRSASEGPSAYVSVGPGVVKLGTVDLARAHRSAETALSRRWKRVCEFVGWSAAVAENDALRALWRSGLLDDQIAVLAETGDRDCGFDPLARFEPRARIREWSGKSRRSMLERFSTLDLEPLVRRGVPAMVTMTMPREWESIAPTGRAFKRLVRLFLRRYYRAWGESLVGLWKLEFQRRGAPHLHVLMVPPTGTADGLQWRQWFARAWADCLGVQGETRDAVVAVHEHRSASADYAEGLRAADPKRVAVYFLKHNYAGDKEYQHVVPDAWRGEGDGPGRFWGYWGLKRADRAVPLTMRQADELGRTLRRWDRARGGVRKARVFRVDARTGQVRSRTVTRRVRPLRGSRGFMLVNDGPEVALMLARRLT